MRLVSSRAILVGHLMSLIAVLVCIVIPFQYNWPDFVHTDYGLPFVWARHTTVVFVGPVDKWEVNLIYLALNILVSILLSFLFSAGLLWAVSRRRQT